MRFARGRFLSKEFSTGKLVAFETIGDTRVADRVFAA
jgi:hypothetical protein